MTRGRPHTIYTQNEDDKIIEHVKRRFGLKYSPALRFIIRQWAEYDNLFTDPGQAAEIIRQAALVVKLPVRD